MSSAGDGDPFERASAAGASVRDRLPFTDNLMLWGVLLAVVVALVLRLLFLGHRVAHYDEGRVAYWSLHTLDTGHFAYRRIIHGPLLQHLDRYLFALFGASDFLMRFPVAVIGGLLPASAYLFRKHLRRSEVVAMGFVLALNPVLLYYSRFMRSDILVAAFMFTALGFLVRYYDTRSHWYLYPATALIVLGFGSKENAIVYVLTWFGAAFLLADQALFRPRNYDSGVHLLWAKLVGSYRHLRDDRLRPWLQSVEAATERFGGSDDATNGGERTSTWTLVRRAFSPLRFVVVAIGILAIAIAVFLYVYAPRGAGYEGLTYPLGDPAAHVGLWDAVGNPAKLPGLLDSTYHYTYDEFLRWFTSASDPGCRKDNIIDGWLCYTGRYVRVMATYAGPMTAFAIFGFLAERYGAKTTRNLVLFAAYGGFVAVLGYPLGTDVWGAWIVVHALVPLSIPAAVGIGVILRWGRDAFESKDGIGVGIAALVLVLATALAGVTAVGGVYTNEQSDQNDLVQYAQPADDMQGVLRAMDEAAAAHDGTDVILYDRSGRIVKENRDDWSANGLAKDPMCSQWHELLPLPWYFAKSDAQVACVDQRAELRTLTADETVPIIITYGNSAGVPVNDLRERYVPRTYRLRTVDTPLTYWVSKEYADELGPDGGPTP